MTPRELATVLAALRFMQRQHFYATREMAEHFVEHEPLSSGEIDQLCEKLNLGESEG